MLQKPKVTQELLKKGVKHELALFSHYLNLLINILILLLKDDLP